MNSRSDKDHNEKGNASEGQKAGAGSNRLSGKRDLNYNPREEAAGNIAVDEYLNKDHLNNPAIKSKMTSTTSK